MLILDLDNTYSVTFKPNSSLTADGKLRVIVMLSVIPFLIGIGFTMIGVWLVMPFVGLELAALAYAFYYINAHENDYESITLDEEKLEIKTSYRGVVKHKILNPYWTKLVQRELVNGELQIGLLSHGKEIAIGNYLTKDQRQIIAEQLQKRIPFYKS